ncbi:hypothetical protein KKB99_00330, partial [bacterium]|nr:hypothetical protein [bacterium]MBU1024431.1 hypothetical protein [bacterium]
EFENIALDSYDSLPDEIKNNLNLGLAVVPESKRGSEGITFILGEYFTSQMLGRGVKLYYGSFIEVMGDAPFGMIQQEIISTVKHELRHHIEISAGVDYLGAEDKSKMQRIKKRYGLLPDDSKIKKILLNQLLTPLLIIIAMMLIIYLLVFRHVQ